MKNISSAVYENVFEIDMRLTVGESTQRNEFGWEKNSTQKYVTQFTPVTYVDEPKEWLQDSFKRLTELSKLNDDWDSYGAESPNNWTISQARDVLKNLSSEDLKPSSIDASVEGGICLSFQSGLRYSDIECFNSGEIFAVTSENGENTKVWEIMNLNLTSTINHIHNFIQSKT